MKTLLLSLTTTFAISTAAISCANASDNPTKEITRETTQQGAKEDAPAPEKKSRDYRFERLKFKQRIGVFLDEIPPAVLARVQPNSSELLTGIDPDDLPDTDAVKKFKAAVAEKAVFIHVIFPRNGGRVIAAYTDIDMAINGDSVEMLRGTEVIKQGTRRDFKNLISFESIAPLLKEYKKKEGEWGNVQCHHFTPDDAVTYPRIDLVTYHPESKLVLIYREQQAPPDEKSPNGGFFITARSDLEHD